MPPIPLPQRRGRVKKKKGLNIDEGSLVSLVAVADTVWNGDGGGAAPPAFVFILSPSIYLIGKLIEFVIVGVKHSEHNNLSW